MLLKSYIVEQNVGVLSNYQATLIYGENDGIKDDIKKLIKFENKDAEVIIFFEEEMLQKKDLLYKSFFNESLFATKKIIFILNATDKIFDQINECSEAENKSIGIYIFSSNLEKRSKLRTLFEKNKNLAIFACYKDNERTLINYINNHLKGFKGLSGEIVNLIISNSNMERKIIKSEIIKIKSFFLEKRINKEEISELLNVKSNSNFDEIRDSALKGEKNMVNKLLSEVDLINEDTFFYLNSFNYRIMKLQEIIKNSQNNKDNYQNSLENLKPPIFWKDKPIVAQQLEKWNLNELTQLATKISKTEILMKKNSYLRNDVVIKDLIINIVCKTSFIYS
jgi:DNA polymerase-3 subunit delta